MAFNLTRVFQQKIKKIQIKSRSINLLLKKIIFLQIGRWKAAIRETIIIINCFNMLESLKHYFKSCLSTQPEAEGTYLNNHN